MFLKQRNPAPQRHAHVRLAYTAGRDSEDVYTNMLVVTALRGMGAFFADQVCAAHAGDPAWRADQLRALATAEDHVHLWNETTVGNLLLLHAHGAPEERRRIEAALTAWLVATALPHSETNRLAAATA